MRVLIRTTHAATVLVLVALGSCGGGGGDSAGTPNTESLSIQVALDAFVNSTAPIAGGPSMFVGDDEFNDDFRSLLMFDLSTVPVGVNVVGAFLHLAFLDDVGAPIANLGHMRFVRYDSNFAASAGAYDAPELAHDPANNLLISPAQLNPRIGLLSLVLSALSAGDPNLAVRIQYENPSNLDGSSDGISIASLAHPQRPAAMLEIVYEVP